MDEKDKIIEELKLELEKARLKEEDHKESRSATLYMLEDLNETTERVQNAERQWKATFDAIIDPLFIHDGEYKIVRANAAYARLSGMDSIDFIGRPYYEVFPKRQGPFNLCVKATDTKAEGMDGTVDEVFVPEAGRLFRVRYFRVLDNSGKYLFAVHQLEDITEAKRLETRIKQEMSVTGSLLSMTEATAKTKDMGKLMEQVVVSTVEALRSDACLSYLIGHGDRDFSPSHSHGLSRAEVPIFNTELVKEDAWYAKKAFDAKAPLFLEQPFDGENPIAPFDEFGAVGGVLLLPLFGIAGPLGLIALFYRQKKALSDADLRIAKGIMHQVSAAIEEARLFKESVDRAMELSRRMETIKVMHEIDRSILSTLESAEILETVVRLIARVIPCDRATIAVVDREKGGFVYTAGFGTGLAKESLVPFSDTSASRVVETRRLEFSPNLLEEKALLPLEQRFADEGFISHIRVPIVVKNAVSAILTVGAKRTGVFTQDAVATLENLANQIGVALENSRLLTDLEDLFLSTVKVLSNTIDAKSPWTSGHSERVTAYAVSIGRAMGLGRQELKNLELSGLLHDIGKLATYESVLDKPGALTEDEVKVIKLHPSKGAEIIEPVRQLKNIVDGIKYHHEYYDGTGYPEGLKGEGIPKMARILTVADTVDAMKADRPYRKGRAMDAVVAELKRCSGSQFDPAVVDAFLSTMGLSSGV